MQRTNQETNATGPRKDPIYLNVFLIRSRHRGWLLVDAYFQVRRFFAI